MPPMTPGYSTDHITESAHIQMCNDGLYPACGYACQKDHPATQRLCPRYAFAAESHMMQRTTNCTGGKLMTVFSAPDYPQFQLPGERYDNLGAVLRLSPPDYTEPAALQFSASLPRPEVWHHRIAHLVFAQHRYQEPSGRPLPCL